MPGIRLQKDDTLPLLRARVKDVAPRALVVGDPARAERIAAKLTGARLIGQNREYSVYAGEHEGTPVTIASHGIGSAGAAVCFEELARAGVTRFVRVGTAGGMQENILDGAIVVALGAVREDGVSHKLVPTEFPATVTPQLAVSLQAAALTRTANTGNPVHSGIVLTSDMFYPSTLEVGTDLKMWQRAGIVAVEMEAAALFIVAALNGAEAAAIFAIDGNPLLAKDEAMAGYDPHRELVTRAVNVAALAGLDVLID